MKRIVFLLTGLLASSQILHAQNNEATKYECIYEYKVNNGNPGEVYSTILMLNDTAAISATIRHISLILCCLSVAQTKKTNTIRNRW